jgi:hypothetical protein
VKRKYIVDVKKDQQEFPFLVEVRREAHTHRAIRKMLKNRINQQDADEILGRKKVVRDDSEQGDW